jgi:hypothetical protein
MVDENIQFFLNGLLVAEIDEAEAVKAASPLCCLTSRTMSR